MAQVSSHCSSRKHSTDPTLGNLCGSALLNTYFRDFFTAYTEDFMSSFMEDLGKRNTTECVAEVLDIAVADFENAKRKFDGFSDTVHAKDMSIHIGGIRGRPAKGILTGRVLVPR